MNHAPPKNKIRRIESTKSDPAVPTRSHQLSLQRNLTDLSKKNSGKPIINNPYEDHKHWVEHLEKKIQQAKQDLKKIYAEFAANKQKMKQIQKQLKQIQSNFREMQKKQRKIKIKLKEEKNETQIDGLKMQAIYISEAIERAKKKQIMTKQILDDLQKRQQQIHKKIKHIQEFIMQNQKRLIQQKYPILPPIKQM